MGERIRETWWPRWATKLPLISMYDISTNKPGSSRDIIMSIGPKNGSKVNNRVQDLLPAVLRLIWQKKIKKEVSPIYWDKLSQSLRYDKYITWGITKVPAKKKAQSQYRKFKLRKESRNNFCFLNYSKLIARCLKVKILSWRGVHSPKADSNLKGGLVQEDWLRILLSLGFCIIITPPI